MLLPALPAGPAGSLVTQAAMAQAGRTQCAMAEGRVPFHPVPAHIGNLLALAEKFVPPNPSSHRRAVLAHLAAAREAIELEMLLPAARSAGLAYAACLSAYGMDAQATAMQRWAANWVLPPEGPSGIC